MTKVRCDRTDGHSCPYGEADHPPRPTVSELEVNAAPSPVRPETAEGQWLLNTTTGAEMEFVETVRHKDYPHSPLAWTGRTRAPEGGIRLPDLPDDPEGRRRLASAMAAPLLGRWTGSG